MAPLKISSALGMACLAHRGELQAGRPHCHPTHMKPKSQQNRCARLLRGIRRRSTGQGIAKRLRNQDTDRAARDLSTDELADLILDAWLGPELPSSGRDPKEPSPSP